MERRRWQRPGDHLTDRLVIDVAQADVRARQLGGSSCCAVVIEPLYGSVAVAAALAAGWGSVEVARSKGGQTPPVPLVSWEQPPPEEHAGGRCRVRVDELHDTLAGLLEATAVAPVLLGSAANARAVARAVARLPVDRVVFVATEDARGAHDPEHDLREERVAADAWWTAGLLTRVLLEELDRDMVLTDAAGIAVTLAAGAELPADQLGRGVRWRRHLARGGHDDDLRVASHLHSIDIVPELRLEGIAPVATIHAGAAG